jgi:hypothetical protein
MLTVSDGGIGMTDAKLSELNAMLESPPVLGLALQPTLGMYVVARLAARHGVRVQMIAGSPGLTIRVLLPKELIEPAHPKEEPASVVEPVPSLTNTTPFRPEPAAIYGGSRSGHSFANSDDEDAPAGAEITVQNGAGTIAGSIVGKHEHPGRQKQRTVFDESIEEVEPMAAPGEETGSLARRIPGEALRSNSDEFEPVEVAAEFESVKRVEVDDDSPWWTKDVVREEEAVTSPSLWDEVESVEAKREPTQFAPSRIEPGRVERRVPPTSEVSEAGLPVRTPGVSFKETDESDISSAASESGAIGIKSALASYADGRDAAGSKTNPERDEEGDGDE